MHSNYISSNVQKMPCLNSHPKQKTSNKVNNIQYWYRLFWCIQKYFWPSLLLIKKLVALLTKTRKHNVHVDVYLERRALGSNLSDCGRTTFDKWQGMNAHDPVRNTPGNDTKINMASSGTDSCKTHWIPHLICQISLNNEYVLKGTMDHIKTLQQNNLADFHILTIFLFGMKQ